MLTNGRWSEPKLHVVRGVRNARESNVSLGISQFWVVKNGSHSTTLRQLMIQAMFEVPRIKSDFLLADVLGLEQFKLGHHNGGSQDHSRIM